MNFLARLFVRRSDRRFTGINPHQESVVAFESSQNPDPATVIDWRTSEGHKQLLISFLCANTVENASRWADTEPLGESIDCAMRRLTTDETLVPVTDAKLRILYGKGSKELKAICREHRLKVSGTKDELAERLAKIDPEGLTLGFKGELLKCSPEAAEIAEAAIERRERTEIELRKDARKLLEGGDAAGALRLCHKFHSPNPMPFMHETNVEDLSLALSVSTPALAFCSDEELKELRVIVAMAHLPMRHVSHGRLAREGFIWDHPMSFDAAIQNLLKAIASQRNILRWRDSGIVKSVKILNSQDGPCKVCLEAAAKTYPIGETPELPIVGCTNIRAGCRCVIVAHFIERRR